MGDHSQAFHLVEVFLDLWAQGDGGFPGGMYYRMNIMLELDLVFTRESTNSCELIWEFLHQVISGPDGLGCCGDCSRPGYCCCCRSRCRTWGFYAGSHDCMAQFIFMTASLLHEARPRMAGPGVSAMYQYKFTQWG